MYTEIKSSVNVDKQDFLPRLGFSILDKNSAHPAERHLRTLSKVACGFSLVEVVIALGVCAFALVSLLSLMPVCLDFARRAVEISRVSKAFQKVGSELTQSSFSSVEALTATSPKWYFDYNGNATTSASDRYYTVTATIDASPIHNQTSASLLRVKLESATPSNTSTESVILTICDMGY